MGCMKSMVGFPLFVECTKFFFEKSSASPVPWCFSAQAELYGGCFYHRGCSRRLLAEYRMRSGMEAAAAKGWATSKALQRPHTGPGEQRAAIRAGGS